MGRLKIFFGKGMGGGGWWGMCTALQTQSHRYSGSVMAVSFMRHFENWGSFCHLNASVSIVIRLLSFMYHFKPTGK